MYTVVYARAKSNKQPLDNHWQRRECQSLFMLRPKSGGKRRLIFFLHQLGCANTHRYSDGWNNAAPLFDNQTRGWKIQACIQRQWYHPRCHTLTNMWHFVSESYCYSSLCFPLASTLLCLQVLVPGRAPTLSLKWTMLLLAEAKPSNCNSGLLSLSGYASDAGWPPHTNIQYCALTWGSTLLYCLQINTSDTHTPFVCTRILTQRGRLCCCILPPEGADNVPPSPLASARDSFRDQRKSLRMLDRQNEPTRQQWAVLGIHADILNSYSHMFKDMTTIRYIYLFEDTLGDMSLLKQAPCPSLFLTVCLVCSHTRTHTHTFLIIKQTSTKFFPLHSFILFYLHSIHLADSSWAA